MPLIAGLGARRHDLPLVVTPHYHGRGHTPFRNLLHLPYRPIGGWAMHRASQVLANSLAEEDWLRRDFGDLPIRLNPNGVDLPSAAGGANPWRPERSADEVTLFTVGRLERYKRVDRAIGALSKLPERYRLTIVGDGPEREALEQRAMRSGVDDRVRFRGHVSTEELQGWYAVADAYLALSEDESFGMTLLEAASAGAPVVASDIPAHDEVSHYLPRERVLLRPRRGERRRACAQHRVSRCARTVRRSLGLAPADLGRDGRRRHRRVRGRIHKPRLKLRLAAGHQSRCCARGHRVHGWPQR